MRVQECITVSTSSNSTPYTMEDPYYNKSVIIRRGPIKLDIYSEHRGGEKYKHFVSVYLFGVCVLHTFWRTECGNAYSFYIRGYTK